MPGSRKPFPEDLPLRTCLRAPVPDFPPVRAGHGTRFPRLGRPGRRRFLPAALAAGAAALALTATDSGPPPRDGTGPAGSGPAAERRSAGRTGTGEEVREAPVSAPVRIADAATVRLLSPGDRIDVLASTSKSASARVVATHVRVAQVPEYRDTVSGDGAEGALIVVVVTRRTAAALAGAAAKSRLAVTLC
ncbi:hypothetical protein AB0939_22420 [Streptomyces sp. NPDC006990]|uniref:hypothetical protein n=1 Tax=Streptomyces sp. NPDC006990 TaxID=3154481 RepID=UPI0034529EC1